MAASVHGKDRRTNERERRLLLQTENIYRNAITQTAKKESERLKISIDGLLNLISLPIIGINKYYIIFHS